jgi:fructose-bisphosphate aldolase class II
MGLEICRGISVPCCLLFNESPALDWVLRSVDLGFNLVMYADEDATTAELIEPVSRTVAYAHARGAAVEAEMASIPGVSGHMEHAVDVHSRGLTEPRAAAGFVERTGVDALAVNIGQMHLHGREHVGLDLSLLAELRAALSVPLVLHGASSVLSEDLARATALGIRKINVGSALKRAFFEALRASANALGDRYSPYDVVGSGFASDVITKGRLAMQAVAEQMMHLFGSAGRA